MHEKKRIFTPNNAAGNWRQRLSRKSPIHFEEVPDNFPMTRNSDIARGSLMTPMSPPVT